MKYIPILDVHVGNAVALWPSITYAMNTAQFIAIDLELSGLGDRSKLASKCLEDRYAEIASAAKSRSIISLGISCFRAREDKVPESRTQEFMIQTYNVLALCSQPFTVEPQALKFLIQHGFDFNKQYQLGLPYKKAGEGHAELEGCSLNNLFFALSAARKPIILHNGLVDLVFLYGNLYLELPPKLLTFLADVEDLFPAGIYDTKYLAEYHVRLKASYLQYVFQSCLKWNEDNNEPIKLEFPKQTTRNEDLYHVPLSEGIKEGDSLKTLRVCQQYAAHGWCKKGSECEESHDVSLIVSNDRLHRVSLKNKKRRLRLKERKKQRRLAKAADSDEDIECEESSRDVINLAMRGEGDDTAQTNGSGSEIDTASKTHRYSENTQKCHRAGVDAFMTGLSYAVFSLQLVESSQNTNELANKLYLSGKNLPLQVTKGNFGKLSAGHALKSQLNPIARS